MQDVVVPVEWHDTQPVVHVEEALDFKDYSVDEAGFVRVVQEAFQGLRVVWAWKTTWGGQVSEKGLAI